LPKKETIGDFDKNGNIAKHGCSMGIFVKLDMFYKIKILIK